MGDESERLDDMTDGGASDPNSPFYIGPEPINHYPDHPMGAFLKGPDRAIIDRMKKRYMKAMNASIGDNIECPGCGERNEKQTYQHKFCDSTCKDRYWNTVDPDRSLRAEVKAGNIPPKTKPKQQRFVLTDQMIEDEIEPILDETCGRLIKDSELKFIVEKYVNRALGIED